MQINRSYLDYNASAPLRPSVRALMVEVLSAFGNASSVHGEGRSQRGVIEKARSQVAQLVGGQSEGVVFTASATEAALLALTPRIHHNGHLRRAHKLYVLASEHPCVLAGGQFAHEDVVLIPVLSNGLIDMQAFERLLEAESDVLPYVAVQLVNSETGVIQPIAEVAQKVHVKGGYILCDAVQAAGRMALDIQALGVDFMLLSAHKMGGPQGAGALIIAHSVLTLDPVIKGGGQEKNRRAGTENVAAIAGFGEAARCAGEEVGNREKITVMRDALAQQIVSICETYGLGAYLTLFAQDAPRVDNTLLFAVQGLVAETALIAFDLEGVAVSSGSACSSGKVGGSHVLKAMQVADDVALGAIRVSIGWQTSENDCALFASAFDKIMRRFKERVT